jgi:hypothetical protein
VGKAGEGEGVATVADDFEDGGFDFVYAGGDDLFDRILVGESGGASGCGAGDNEEEEEE